MKQLAAESGGGGTHHENTTRVQPTTHILARVRHPPPDVELRSTEELIFPSQARNNAGSSRFSISIFVKRLPRPPSMTLWS